MVAGPLTGLRVLEVASFITGPLTAQLLGDLGAEVVKVEPPVGDGMRRWDPNRGSGDTVAAGTGENADDSIGSAGYGSGFQAYNRNKRSIVLDLRNPGASDVIRRMLPSVDVIVENMRPGVAERLGVGYEQARSVNPAIIYCSVTGLGREGPFAQRAMYDTTAQALSGALSLMVAAHDPRPVGVTLCDSVGGMYAAYGVLSALFARERTGQGQRVDVSMVGASIAFLAEAVTRHFTTGSTPDATGRCAVSQAYVFECADHRQLAIHLSTPDKFWTALTEAIGRKDLRDEDRFATGADRVRNYAELYDELRTTFATRRLSEWLAVLDGADVPHEPVLNVDEALQHEKVRPLRLVRSVEHPMYGPVRTVAPGVALSKTPLSVTLAPPALGEHTREVLDQCGFSDSEIDALVDQEVVSLGAVGDGTG